VPPALPDVSQLTRAPQGLAGVLTSFGLTASFIRTSSEPGDDLRGPLRLTRAAMLRDDVPSQALRLWMGGEPQPRAGVEAWMGSGLLEALLACGLLQTTPTGAAIQAPFHLRLVEHLFLFSDYLGTHDDAVMGAGETTELLYQAAWPTLVPDHVLDLGCGAGTVALLLAGRAVRVTGTDISPRAIAIAACNARINGVRNAVFRTGDCFAPVEDERFDLIVSQPPYYPQERAGSQVFLAGGPRGDEIARRLLSECPRYLSNLGRALVLSSWAPDAGVPHPPGTRALELYTPVGDVPDTRQSLVVVEPAPRTPWQARFLVPGERWGAIRASRIDELLRCQERLRGQPGELRMVDTASCFLESGQRFVQARSQALLPTRAISEAEWAAWRDPQAATPASLRDAVTLGWLVPK